MKSFNRKRLLEKYRRVIIDGTGLFYLKEKHCGSYLVTTVTWEKNRKGTKVKRYYHKVLETKLILGAGIIISLNMGLQYDEEPLSNHPDSRYRDAVISGMKSAEQRDKPKHKKYILEAAGKFLKQNSNG